MNAETLLHVEGLTKAYGDNVVLENISTEIKKGRLWRSSDPPVVENPLF